MYRKPVRRHKTRRRSRISNKSKKKSIKLHSDRTDYTYKMHGKRSIKPIRNKGRKRFTGRNFRGGDPSGTIRNIPVFIISYNQYTYLKSMVEQLSKFPGMTLHIIDNKSTYPPLIDYLKSIEGTVKVLYQPENYGHKVYERDDIVALGGEKYVITDPDLLLNPKLPQNFIERMVQLCDKYKANRVGFALDITNNINLNRKIKITSEDSNIHGTGTYGFKQFEGMTIPEFESQYWKKRIDDPDYELYSAPIDTTFTMINKEFYIKGHTANCIRIAGDFTAVHRTWLNGFEKDLIDGEYDFYLGAGNISSTTKIWKDTTIQSSNMQTHIGGEMKRVFLYRLDEYRFFKEYLESICDGDEIRSWTDKDTIPGDTFYMCIRRLPYDKIPPSCKIGFINVEQLTNPQKLNEYKSIIRDNIDIYDYSQDNINIVGKGIYLPYKEKPEETKKLKSFMDVKKEYDVAILMSDQDSKRRVDCINELIEKGINVHQIHGWADERDKEIGKASILLNIHHSEEYKIYESIRCDRWRFAGMPIISEASISPMPEGITESTLADFSKNILKILGR